MAVRPPESEAKVKVIVDKDPVPTSFEKWGQPGHFDRTLAKGPKPQPGFGISTPTSTISTVKPVI